MGKFRFALLSVGLCMVAGKPSGESQRDLSGGPVLDNRWEGFGSSVPDVVDSSRVGETGDRSFVAQNTQDVTGVQQPPLASGNMEDVTGVEVKSSFFDDIQGLQSVNLQERVRPVVTERTRSWQEPSGDNLGASGHREEALGDNFGAPVDQEEASGDNTGVAGSGQEASGNNLGAPVDQEEASGDNTDVDDDWKEPKSHLQDREVSLQDSSDDLHMSTTTDDLVIVDVSPRPVDSSLSLEDITFPGLHSSEWVNLETSSENMKTPVQDMKTPPGKKPWKPSSEKTKPPAQDMKPLDKDMKTPPGKKPWKPSSEDTKPSAQDMKPHVDTKDMKTPPGKKPWKPSSADKDVKPLDKDMKTPPGKKPWKTSKSGEETQHLLEPSSTESDVEKTRFQEQGWFQRLLGSNLPKHVAKKPKIPSLLPVAEEKKLPTGKPLLVNNDYVLVSQKKPHGNLGLKPSSGKPAPDMEKGLTQMLLKAW